MIKLMRITPKPEWIVGDYVTGSSCEKIARLWALPVESVEAIVAAGLERRTGKKAIISKPKHKRRCTNWQTLTRTATVIGIEKCTLEAMLGTPEGERIGLERRLHLGGQGSGSAYRWRAFFTQPTKKQGSTPNSLDVA